jgi:hypothetical protein
MPTVTAVLPVNIDDAQAALRGAASQHGYSLDEGHSDHDRLTFHKGVTLVSWGSNLLVQLESLDDSSTRVSISTSDTFAITDWGRGKRAATKLLLDAGANADAIKS